ncbi:MAG TPA: GNAT family N-acetyltransferase [Thermoanaerobaculaceae bacterium]|nr:GNAT family N-acetyltransferase [Thermoanaerobaculaceae bacterium]
MNIRTDLRPQDRAPLEQLLHATGFFNVGELEVALELVDDRLTHGEKSHYRFLVLEGDDEVLGYACWGPIPGTVASADLYWIAVHPGRQGQGLGRALLDAAETWIAREGRTRVYLETSTRPQYVPTRAFYLRCGYEIAAELPDFYAPGDGKAIFLKVLPRLH